MITRLSEAISPSNSRADYAKGIRDAIRGLWGGHMDQFSFIDAMVLTIRRHLGRAFDAGAAAERISPVDYTEEEIQKRSDYINQQFQFLPSFSQRVQNGSKANGGKLGRLLIQGKNWAARWDSAFLLARVTVGDNVPMEWVLGVAEHCASCLKLAGKVKRKRYWEERGILPRQAGAKYLACRGFLCTCRLLNTDKPLSRGPLPKLP